MTSPADIGAIIARLLISARPPPGCRQTDLKPVTHASEIGAS